MKRLGKGLYDRIISMENLWAADAKAQMGKKGRDEVMEHNKHQAEDLQALHVMLRDKTYKPSPYRIFHVHEPKEREIAALPFFPDRIIHHAIMNVLEPTWKHTFTYNSYACIRGRGISACAKHVRRIIDDYVRRDERCYCLKIDVRHFYPSINGEVLKSIIRRRVKCKDTLWLLDTIIDSAQGLPIGNYVSQYLANLYLAPFMHKMTDEVKVECVEYSDDMVFFSADKAGLHSLLNHTIRPYLQDVLRLEVKGNWQVFPIATNRYAHDGRALDFVGYTFYREHTGLRKRVKKNFARSIARLHKHGVSGRRLAIKAASWTGWCKHADCKHLTTSIMGKETKFVKYLKAS